MTFVLEQIGAKPGDFILDPFMGSDSIGVAATRFGMLFIGIELDPSHFDTALRRLTNTASQ
jgi:site-specific DNA-methyltransferase (adenine-specific)